MSSTPESILLELTSAFPAIRPEGPGSVVAEFNLRTPEGVRTATAFDEQTDWTRIDGAWLEAVSDSLSGALAVLTPQARKFYLPAFMAADLRGELKRVEPHREFLRGLTGWVTRKPVRGRWDSTAAARADWAVLTLAQCRAVVHYLEWVSTRHGPAPSPSIVEALNVYWYGRVAELTG